MKDASLDAAAGTAEPQKCSFTFEVTEEQQEALIDLLEKGNYTWNKVDYALCSAEGDHLIVTLYEKERHGKRKLCVLGRKAQEFIEFQLEPNGIVPTALGYEKILSPELFSAHAGSDESGKGDFFGPLVVCCCYTDEALSDEMRKLGVKDCKQMTDKAVLSVGARLRQLLGPTGHAVVRIGPAAYNRLYAKIRNINRLLAWAHSTAIEDLLTKRPGCDRVVVDQFAPTEATIRRVLKPLGKKAEVVQRHKAESDIAVAAASVIARETFIRACLDMGRECFGENPAEGERIPLGSSDPRVRELAERMVKANGPVWLMNHCKAHFQTTDKVLAACGLSRIDLPPEGQVKSAVANGDFKSKGGKGQ